MTELNTDEMEMANGGIDFDVKKAIGWCIAGGVAIGAAAVAVGRGTRVLE